VWHIRPIDTKHDFGGASGPLCLSSSALHFSYYSFLVHHPVNQDDRHLLACAMASDSTVAWQFSQREQLFFYGLFYGNSTPEILPDIDNNSDLKTFRTKTRSTPIAKPTDTRVARFFSVILTKTGENIPNSQQICQMAINYTKYQWFENIPSDNPDWYQFLTGEGCF
jgi:hypothetical protein